MIDKKKPNMDADLIKKFRKIMNADHVPEQVTRLHGDRFIDEDGRIYRLRTERQIDAAKRAANIGKDFRHFSFAHMENINEVIAAVPVSFCGHLLHLQCFMELYTGILIRDNTLMDWNDIQRTLSLRKTAFYDFKDAMTAHNIIEKTANEDGEVCYRINPRYHFRNELPEDNRVIKTFTRRVKEICRALKPEEVGVIYKLLPYVHQNTNTICSNPFEKDPTKINQLTAQQIADLVGMSAATLSKYFNIAVGDQCLFAQVKVGRRRYYKINPWIFYRKNGRPDDTLLEMFAPKKRSKRR